MPRRKALDSASSWACCKLAWSSRSSATHRSWSAASGEHIKASNPGQELACHVMEPHRARSRL
eukprot:8210076-Lingulodinium_polyedra.AAC.1